jgi:hypothetical protein
MEVTKMNLLDFNTRVGFKYPNASLVRRSYANITKDTAEACANNVAEPVSSNFLRNALLILALVGVSVVIYKVYSAYRERDEVNAL